MLFVYIYSVNFDNMWQKTTITLVFIWIQTLVGAQVQQEVIPPDFIKSISFKSSNPGDQFPVVKLGDAFFLEFDDITAEENDYYYKIIHCNYDWTPSDLLKSQYLQGFDNQRIVNYRNSYGPLQPYSHYSLELPNSATRFKITGNYMLEIYNSYDELLFSRRFVIFADRVQVGVALKRSRDLSVINQAQTVQFEINARDYPLVNPLQTVHVAILQNHHWPSAIVDIKPQFTVGNALIYKYDAETRFYGGNEYYNFDTKDLRVTTAAIQYIEKKEVYHHFLYTNIVRNNLPYTYFPDINGDFVIRTLQGEDSATEAEYTRVHFSLAYEEFMGLNEIYVFGKFNNYALTEENRLKFNEETALLETSLLLKQGFYNYKYVMADDQGRIDDISIDGSFYETENNYLVLVYYRDFGAQYDSLIGIGSASSVNITN